jgi:hypothetical protein
MGSRVSQEAIFGLTKRNAALEHVGTTATQRIQKTTPFSDPQLVEMVRAFAPVRAGSPAPLR